jgi:hypothetical protein
LLQVPPGFRDPLRVPQRDFIVAIALLAIALLRALRGEIEGTRYPNADIDQGQELRAYQADPLDNHHPWLGDSDDGCNFFIVALQIPQAVTGANMRQYMQECWPVVETKMSFARR